MDNTQLPAEVLEEIKTRSFEINTIEPVILQGERIDINYIKRAVWLEGATEYAIKLHQAKQEIDQLKRWKMEAVELLTPIHAYVHKHIEAPLGCCNVKLVLDRCKHFEQACTLLEKFISRHEAGLLPDRLLYNEIKSFLDGEK